MDSVTQTVLAGTQQVANAIGGAADARERRRARARQAWDRLAENTGKFASWVDEKAYETDAQSISDAVAAASIGGDYEKALQALANIPTKTAKGAADKLKAAMLLKNKQTEMDIEASRRVNDEAELRLRERGMDIESQRNAWMNEDRVAKREAQKKSGLALRAARAPMEATVNMPVGMMMPGVPSQGVQLVPRTGMAKPNAEQVYDRYVAGAGGDADETIVRILSDAVAKERSAADAKRAKVALETQKSRELELKREQFIEQKRQNTIQNGFDVAKFNWDKEVDSYELWQKDQAQKDKVASEQQQFNLAVQRLVAQVQKSHGDRILSLALAKMNETGRNYRAQIAMTFDPNQIVNLRDEAISELNKSVEEATSEVREQEDRLMRPIQEAFPGAKLENPTTVQGEGDGLPKTLDPELRALMIEFAKVFSE